jgi:hypothetical protein
MGVVTNGALQMQVTVGFSPRRQGCDLLQQNYFVELLIIK